jgi:CHAT domain-containing protein
MQKAQLQRQSRRRIQEALTTLYAQPVSQRDQSRVTQLQEQGRLIDHTLADVTQQIDEAFPDYATLMVPEPLDVAAMTALLRPNEAVISFYSLENSLLMWLIRPGLAPRLEIAPITRDALEDLVAKVRRSMDQVRNSQFSQGQLLPFDVEGAHNLYQLLLGPLRVHLTGITHLLIVPDGALMTLPFAALVTRAAGEAYQKLHQHSKSPYGKRPLPLTAPEMENYRQLSWLIQDHALTILPTATSLRLLRQRMPLPGAPTERLIGFGDPVLFDVQRQSGVHLTNNPRFLNPIQQLPALPETAIELKHLAQALGADPSTALFLGPRATETQLRRLNEQGRLAMTQILAFATHGLTRGEIAGLTQPALVLTSPHQASPIDNGLLTLEEIFELRLPRTEWVILSACNTAASDASGEGLSGLTRAFFFAGARSVLASHWYIDDEATQALMKEMFTHYTNSPQMSQAEALRQGMSTLIQRARGRTAYFAHPYAWAAFFLAGTTPDPVSR